MSRFCCCRTEASSVYRLATFEIAESWSQIVACRSCSRKVSLNSSSLIRRVSKKGEHLGVRLIFGQANSGMISPLFRSAHWRRAST